MYRENKNKYGEIKMKKLLLIGKLNEVIQRISENLLNDFQVQLCSENIESVKSMYKITKPDILVINCSDETDIHISVMEWIKNNVSDIPVLYIIEKSNWNSCKSYCMNENIDKIFESVIKSELLEKCYQMLNEKEKVNESKEIQERKKIMIVDDSPLLLRNMKSLLENKYTVFIANSGEQAFKFVPNKQPDLILLDYEMPGWNGKITYEMLKKQEGSKDIPVIFLTSMSDKEHIYSILETKPAGYILKPPDKDRLFSAIEAALNKK